MGNQPTYEELVTMPAYADHPVPVAFEDSNGFLNVRHYLGIGSEGLDEMLAGVGIPFNWPQVTGLACLSAEHHLTYLHELKTGDDMSVRARLLGRSERAAHALVYLLDDTNQRVACRFEEILLCVELDARRTAPWPDDVAKRMDELVAEHAALPWSAQSSGCLALR